MRRGLTPLQRCNRRILQANSTGQGRERGGSVKAALLQGFAVGAFRSNLREKLVRQTDFI